MLEFDKKQLNSCAYIASRMGLQYWCTAGLRKARPLPNLILQAILCVLYGAVFVTTAPILSGQPDFATNEAVRFVLPGGRISQVPVRLLNGQMYASLEDLSRFLFPGSVVAKDGMGIRIKSENLQFSPSSFMVLNQRGESTTIGQMNIPALQFNGMLFVPLRSLLSTLDRLGLYGVRIESSGYVLTHVGSKPRPAEQKDIAANAFASSNNSGSLALSEREPAHQESVERKSAKDKSAEQQSIKPQIRPKILAVKDDEVAAGPTDIEVSRSNVAEGANTVRIPPKPGFSVPKSIDPDEVYEELKRERKQREQALEREKGSPRVPYQPEQDQRVAPAFVDIPLEEQAVRGPGLDTGSRNTISPRQSENSTLASAQNSLGDNIEPESLSEEANLQGKATSLLSQGPNDEDRVSDRSRDGNAEGADSPEGADGYDAYASLDRMSPEARSAELRKIEVENKSRSTAITLTGTPALRGATEPVVKGNTVELRLRRTRNTAKRPELGAQSAVTGVEVGKEGAHTVVKVTFRSKVKVARMKQVSATELLLTVEHGAVAGSTSESEESEWELDVVVLDPGHGGDDVGAVSLNGHHEKDIVLKIARKVRDLLRKTAPSVKVVMTRNDDSFVELGLRGQIANKEGGKLFVSIHCNSMPTKPHPAHGCESYILRPNRNSEAVRVAEKENASLKLEKDTKSKVSFTDEQVILATMAQSAFVRFSERFAKGLQKSVSKTSGLVDRGVNQAGFFVLVGASMPNVLFETGFLSNAGDEKILVSDEGQDKIAKGMARAILQYARQFTKADIPTDDVFGE